MLIGSLAILFNLSARSQTIDIGPNEYAFQYTTDPDFGLYFNASSGRYEFLNGAANPVLGFNANNGGLTTNLSFESGSDLLIGNNRYAFRAASNSNFGLYFNASSTQYEFLNNAASPIFAINANTGEYASDIEFEVGSGVLVKPNTFGLRSAVDPDAGVYFGGPEIEFRDLSGGTIFGSNITTGDARVKGGMRVGNSTSEQTGNIRWSGSDFEGYDGSTWTSLTAETPGPQGPQGIQGEQGPQGEQGASGILPDGELSAVPFYDGTDWQVTSTGIRSDGESLQIGDTVPFFLSDNANLYVGDEKNEAVADKSVISAYRRGLNYNQGMLPNWSDSDVAIRGTNDWGNSYSAAILGSAVLDYNNSAAVLGRTSSAFSDGTFGALAYRNDQGLIKAGYFNGNVQVLGDLEVGASVTIEQGLTTKGNLGVWENLNVLGATALDSTLNVTNRVTVESAPNDTIGINLLDRQNYYQSNNWVFGESDGVGTSLPADYLMSYFGNEQYLFWTSYIRPSVDGLKSLGLPSYRWSTMYASNGTINTSDAREKKNIKEIDYGLETLMELKPVSYEWREDHMNVGTKLGFVAQDLLEVVPEVVVTQERIEDRETGEVTYEEAERMGVFYDDLIPVLTKAIQEQQGTIEDLNSENKILKDRLNSVLERMDRFEQDLQTCCFNSESEAATGGASESSQAELGQNIPNPFSESTVIRYYLPNGCQNAIIRITDIDGSPVEDIRLGDQKGANQVEFQTQGLASGTYLYSLFVDGKFVDSKKMMIAR